jgi:hypothetical protein
VPISIALHQTLGKAGISCSNGLCFNIQRPCAPAHEIGYRLQFMQKIVYNLVASLIANSGYLLPQRQISFAHREGIPFHEVRRKRAPDNG